MNWSVPFFPQEPKDFIEIIKNIFPDIILGISGIFFLI